MLHRAAIVICSIIATETASIFYINSTSIIFHYIFASLSSVLVSASIILIEQIKVLFYIIMIFINLGFCYNDDVYHKW